ncbi:gag-pol polyprotein [Cucumis melo var. makuwa]|uniref:Gag-pol polyprotein n=1 Tax=Cucumis melo var. makuwa TaxID=1194695 RepID=A0A5D3CGS2_CUCMM|nr:gag-pol polyprotein [Cucumis melo var. makuwa]TYK11001.1 gag-pol polyprotein [Cucumis melo var. makuwa]
MTKEETIAKFNVRVLDIAKESDALGEKMSDSKLVRKVRRSLPSKFNMKVTTIEEANDLSKMKLDELFGSLQTFELNLGDGENKKKPSLALTSIKEKLTEEHQVSQNKDSLAESMVLLTKQVTKLKKVASDVPEETTTSTEDHVSSFDNHTSELQSTEGPGEPSIPRSPSGHVVFFERFLRLVLFILALSVSRLLTYRLTSMTRMLRSFIKSTSVGSIFIFRLNCLINILAITLPTDYAVSYPTPERLAAELIEGTVSVRPIDG